MGNRELAEVTEIMKEYRLLQPDSHGPYLRLFERITGRLRDKTLYPFNSAGHMDDRQDELVVALQKASFSIAKTIVLREEGLSQIEWYESAKVATFHPRSTDWLFDYFVDDGYSALHSACERLGGYMRIFFQAKRKRLSFGEYLDQLSPRSPSSEDFFRMLLNFKDGTWRQEIAKERNQGIHRASFFGSRRAAWLKHLENREAISNMNREREKVPEKLLRCYVATTQCIEPALKLISAEHLNAGQRLNGASLRNLNDK